MKVQPIEPHDRVLIVGKSGSGKSHCGKALATRELERGRWRMLVIDPEDEWSAKGKRTPYVTLGPLRDRATYAEFQRDPVRWLDAEALQLAIVPSSDPEEAAEQVAHVVSLVEDTGEILCVFGEVLFYGRQPAGAKAIAKVATRGRHWGCPVVFESQRMVHIPLDARSQATQLESFLQNAPADIDALDDLVGLTDPEFSRRVQRLHVGESEYWRDTLTRKKETTR